ncbi:MAG: pitrilysin family protein [Bacilli bacterium]|nr:pitrilysin family protein [Bacilli bacterium]MDD4547598.1 pitrilysin family protein [Bacilli bacterium]
MKVTPFNKLDLDLYYEKLDNGLEVYIVPKSNVNNIHVTFSTKYGSKHSEFVPFNSKKMTKVPDGIAHFLEHKLFEQKDGTDPFTFYTERGADANANTSNHKTTYLFSGSTNVIENLNYLLDFVQDPYFTDENVSKEKGIIEQEIKMYADNPFYAIYEKSLYNSFHKNPIRIPIAGTVESINTITKEDLYLCYNTFYHPSNMFVVVTGNVSPEIIIDAIKKNQSNKKFLAKNGPIKLKQYNEPDTVVKKKEILKMNVPIPKIAYNYKFNLTRVKDIPKLTIRDYVLLYFELKFGETSSFNEELKNSEIINENLDYTIVFDDTHALLVILADTKKTDELIEKIKNEIVKFNIDEADFERKKKSFISAYIYMSDSIYRINNKIMGNVINEGKVLTNDYDDIKNMSFTDLKKVIDSLVFDNSGYVIIKPKK